MGSARERPRVVAAQTAGVILLLVIGFLLGGWAKGDSTDPALEQRVERLERSNARLERQVRDQTRRADTAEAAAKRQARGFKRRLRRAAVREVRFRRALRRARAAND